MAQKTIVTLIDDLDGSRAEESIEFGLDGVEYSIDVSAENAHRLRDALQEFISAGRRVGGRKHRASLNGAVHKPARDRVQTQAVREWARRNGFPELSGRGRIPQQVEDAYNAAHSQG